MTSGAAGAAAGGAAVFPRARGAAGPAYGLACSVCTWCQQETYKGLCRIKGNAPSFFFLPDKCLIFILFITDLLANQSFLNRQMLVIEYIHVSSFSSGNVSFEEEESRQTGPPD